MAGPITPPSSLIATYAVCLGPGIVVDCATYAVCRGADLGCRTRPPACRSRRARLGMDRSAGPNNEMDFCQSFPFFTNMKSSL
jgi:hypothetical protein